MDKNLTEKMISGETLFDGRIVRLERWKAELPDGKTAEREIVRHVGAAAVLAANDKGEVCMVRQFRAPIGRVTWEIPAGKLDHRGEDPLLAARRELSEETGITASRWRHLSAIYTTVGFCDEKIDLYLASGLTAGTPHRDEDEFLEVRFSPYRRMLEWVFSGRILDAKTVCALLLAKPLLLAPEDADRLA